MEKWELVYLSSKCAEKGWDFEALKYGDDLYGKEKHADDVWEYVEEIEEYGRVAFREKYAEFKMFPGF